ncbi:MAG: radical SAM protein [Alphaproteobacteria bacterium]|nr:radical SAM protein [Alphaproteobacteria bacterium]
MFEVVFVVKVSKFCNLRCAYCYEHRELRVRDMMREEVLEALFADVDRFGAYLRAQGIIPKFSFVWHGGEPLLLRPEYYLRIAELQKQLICNFAYRNSVQSNLHGANKESLAFVLEMDWELGVSIDFAGGVRASAGGRDSNRSVIAAAERLRKSGRTFGAISVLGKHNRHTLAEAYDWVSEFAEGWRILPVFDGGPEPEIARLRLPEEEIVAVFTELMERRANAPRYISIVPLDDYIRAATLRIAGPRALVDLASTQLDNIFIFNVNGDVYTRPFAYEPAFCLGNIGSASLAEMIEGAAYRSCQEVIHRRKVQNCAKCEFSGFCTSAPMHEHGAVTAADGASKCHVTRMAISAVETHLVSAGVDRAIVAEWAREWLAA